MFPETAIIQLAQIRRQNICRTQPGKQADKESYETFCDEGITIGVSVCESLALLDMNTDYTDRQRVALARFLVCVVCVLF